jgi:hypothetical protein
VVEADARFFRQVYKLNPHALSVARVTHDSLGNDFAGRNYEG